MDEEQLRILETLHSPHSRQELAEKLDYSPKTITNAIGDLESAGLISRDRSGQETVVSPADAKCLEVYQSLVASHPHIDFPDLLTESLIRLLYHLPSDDWVVAATLIEESGLAKSTVYRHLKTLRNRAIVLKETSKYRLADEFEELHLFAKELQHHHHRQRLRSDAAEASILWETDDEFLARTTQPIPEEGYHQTGLDAFAEYGLEFFTTSEYYYFYSPDRTSLTPADFVCHLLLIENDARHRKYALLLLEATDESLERVRDRASYYGLDELLTDMITYIESRGNRRANQLPPWDELKSLAADYGVDL